MALAYTSTELLTSIREQGRIPDESGDATDAKLLLIANRQMDQVFVPLTRKARAEWYLTWQDYTIVAGTGEYKVPQRATTNSVRTVLWIDSSNVQRELPPVPLTDRHLYPPSQGTPCVYTIADDRVVLLPTPNAALGTLRLVYERRHAMLVDATTSCRLCTSATIVGTSYRLVLFGSQLWVVGDQVDIVDQNPPFSQYVTSATVTDDTPFDITFGTQDRLPPTALAGATLKNASYVCTAGESPIPQIPAELHSLLALATAVEWLLPIDPQMASVLDGKLQQGLASVGSLMAPRQQGRQMKLKSTSSRLRKGGTRRGFLSDWHS